MVNFSLDRRGAPLFSLLPPSQQAVGETQSVDRVGALKLQTVSSCPGHSGYLRRMPTCG